MDEQTKKIQRVCISCTRQLMDATVCNPVFEFAYICNNPTCIRVGLVSFTYQEIEVVRKEEEDESEYSAVN